MKRGLRTSALTIVELLITLGVITILLGIGFVNLRTPAASLFAQDLQAQLMQARQEAVKRNGPVAVVWQDTFEEVTTRFTDTRDWAFSTSPCFDSPATILRTRSASEYRTLRIEVDPSDAEGTVYLPNGQRRDCDGAAASTVQIAIDDGRNSRTVTIQPLGRVEIQ